MVVDQLTLLDMLQAGTIFVNGMAWAILENTSWRVLLIVCSIPPLLAMLSFPFMPESPHWLLTVGKHKQAADVLRRAAALNGRPNAIGPNTDIVLHRVELADAKSVNDAEVAKEQEGHSLNPMALFGSKLLRTTIMLWIIWTGTGMCVVSHALCHGHESPSSQTTHPSPHFPRADLLRYHFDCSTILQRVGRPHQVQLPCLVYLLHCRGHWLYYWLSSH